MTVVLLLGIAIGTVLGLTGAGGGMLAVPALVAAMGWSMQQAAPVALFAVSVGAAVGAAEGFMRKLVRYRAGFLIAAIGVPFTMLGGAIAQQLSQRVLTVTFALLMLAVAVRLWRQVSHGDAERASSGLLVMGHVDPDTGRFKWTAATAMLLSAIGVIAGLMAGMFGVGGGFVIVPLMRRFTNLSMHGIVATSLFVIALVGAGGIGGAAMRGTDIQLVIALPFAAATVTGILAGRVLARRLPAAHVQRAFSALLACVAVALLVKSAVQ